MKNGTRTAALSIQHVLAMYAGAVIVTGTVAYISFKKLFYNEQSDTITEQKTFQELRLEGFL